MCGRFILCSSGETLAEAFQLISVPQLRPRWNIAPAQSVAVIRPAADGQRELAMLRWGLIPSWAKDPGIGARLINARSETAAEKPSFRAAFRHRRCLVPADGFYEWAPKESGRQPYLFRFHDKRPFAIAGLWERWHGPGEAIETCTLLTTEANRTVGSVHPRMPAILDDTESGRWLSPELRDPGRLRDLLHPRRDGELSSSPVSKAVNRVAHDTPQCIVPLAEVLSLEL